MSGNRLRLIATEEAFTTPEQVEAMRALAASTWDDPDLRMWREVAHAARLSPARARIVTTIHERMADVGAGRLADMDANDVDMHVLLLTAPGVQLFDADSATAIAAISNDRLQETIRRRPDRFAGLATVAPQDPGRAADEIERAVKKLGLGGIVINSHTNGEYLDDHKFWPIFEAAAACDAPIYIHPRNLPAPVARYYTAAIDLNGAIFGFQAETGLHALRLIVSGVFDRFPTLRIVLGHLGEALPFWLYRLDYMYRKFPARPGFTKAQLLPSEYLKRNFAITTSGVNFHPTLRYCHEVLGVENIMFAIDYPYQESPEAVAFIRSAPLPRADLEQIAHGNAERIFRISSGKVAAGPGTR